MLGCILLAMTKSKAFMIKVWMNGKSVDIGNAKISVFDRGFLYGDGIFETMRCYGGKVFGLDEHMNRLFRSLDIMRINLPYNKKDLEKAIYKTLRTNKLKDAYIRLTITRGEGIFSLSHDGRFKPNVFILVKDFKGYPNRIYERGISVVIAKTRQNEYSPVSKIKSLNFLNYIIARLEAEESGAREAILMNTRGYIAEASSSNIFLVKRSRIITPSLDSGILSGITRAFIIKIAMQQKIIVKEKLVKYRELLDTDEIFLTNSIAEVLPVTRIGTKKVGDGRPGTLTKLIHLLFKKKMAGL